MAETRLMKKVYHDPIHPGSFGGVERLRKAVQDETGKKVTCEKVQEFLSEQDAFTLHKPARIHFPRNSFCHQPFKTIPSSSMRHALAEYNDGYNYQLTYFQKKLAFVLLSERGGRGF